MEKLCLIFCVFCAFCVTSCEQPTIDTADRGNVTLTFSVTNRDATRAAPANYFDKLNIQLFDADGAKVFDKVRTQTKDADGFGTLELNLTAGKYWVVAVGHSSKISATIKSAEVVQFTASNGEKLTDTFCHCSEITVTDAHTDFALDMYRAVAMVQLSLTDETVPANFEYLKMEYTGGSANFNPKTLQGITKSQQSENRLRNSLHLYQCFTFPYLSDTGTLKMKVTATDRDGTVISQRELTDVPVQRNRITTYTGHLFSDGDGEFSMSDFSFVVHADWEGENNFTF